MNSFAKLTSAGILLTITSLSMAQVIPSGSGYLFRAKYKKGDVLKYGVDAVVKGFSNRPSEGIKVHFNSTMVVTDLKGGIATVRLDLGTPTAGGQALGEVAGNTAVVRLNNRNQTMDGPSITNTTAQFPGDPIKVGGTWKAEVPVLIGNSKPTSVRTVYKLIGFKTVNGKKAAVLSMTVGGTASGSGKLLISVRDGSILSSTMKVNLQTSPGSSYPVDVTIQRA